MSIKVTMDTGYHEISSRESHQWWKWLAYGLFSKRALKRWLIKSLAVTNMSRMSKNDVRGFRAVMCSEHPEETLFNCPRGSVAEWDAVLARGAIVQGSYTDLGESWSALQIYTFKYGGGQVRVFSDDGNSEWVHVLDTSFGHGRLLVRRQDLTISNATLPEADPLSLTSLTISLMSDNSYNPEGLGGFLAAIGSSLRYLTIHYDGEMTLRAGLLRRYCPNLEVLSIWSMWIDARLDFREYRAHSLPLPLIDFKWWTHDVDTTVAALSDPSNVLAQCLTRVRIRLDFTVGFTAVRDVFRTETCLRKLMEILEVNQTLEYVEVLVPEDELRRYYHEFKRFYLVPIKRSHLLGVEAKLAFLSVLEYRKPSIGAAKKRMRVSSRVSTGNFDEPVLRKIFRFAAPPYCREVYIRPYPSAGWRDPLDV